MRGTVNVMLEDNRTHLSGQFMVPSRPLLSCLVYAGAGAGVLEVLTVNPSHPPCFVVRSLDLFLLYNGNLTVVCSVLFIFWRFDTSAKHTVRFSGLEVNDY